MKRHWEEGHALAAKFTKQNTTHQQMVFFSFSHCSTTVKQLDLTEVQQLLCKFMSHINYQTLKIKENLSFDYIPEFAAALTSKNIDTVINAITMLKRLLSIHCAYNEIVDAGVVPNLLKILEQYNYYHRILIEVLLFLNVINMVGLVIIGLYSKGFKCSSCD
jgi:hypothetical protein